MGEFLHHYVEILSDPAHLAVEVTLMLMVDVLFLGMVWPFVKRAVRRHDKAVHGVATHTPELDQTRREILAHRERYPDLWGDKMPCLGEHTPGLVCIRPLGHPPIQTSV